MGAGMQVVDQPLDQTALGTKTVNTSWDNGTEFALPAGTIFCTVYVPGKTYLIADDSQDDPADTPSAWGPEGSHKVPCNGKKYLHFKGGSGVSGEISVTAHHE